MFIVMPKDVHGFQPAINFTYVQGMMVEDNLFLYDMVDIGDETSEVEYKDPEEAARVYNMVSETLGAVRI